MKRTDGQTDTGQVHVLSCAFAAKKLKSKNRQKMTKYGTPPIFHNLSFRFVYVRYASQLVKEGTRLLHIAFQLL